MFSIVNLSNGQVTILDIEKEIIKEYPKPPVYDSLENWEIQNKISDYKKYIGLRTFLPPYELPDKNNTVKRIPILYSNPSVSPLNIETRVRWTQFYYLNHNSNIEEIKYENLYSIVYKPFQYYASHPDVSFDRTAIRVDNNMDAKNTYYTVIDVIYGAKLNDLKNNFKKLLDDKKEETQSIIRKYKDELYKGKASSVWHNYDSKIIVDESTDFFNINRLLVLVNEKNKDTVYTFREDRLVLVPYFIKKQEMMVDKLFIIDDIVNGRSRLEKTISTQDKRYEIEYEGNYGDTKTKFKEVIVQYGSIWKCIDVTLTPPNYNFTYIFENEKNEQIMLTDFDLEYKFQRLIYLEDYNLREKNKRIKKEELAKKQELDIKEENLKKERLEQKRRSHLVTKYGSELGQLIAEGKVKIGMNMDMCNDAWGIPFSKSKIATANSSTEIWFYGFGYRLYFKDNKLVEINE
jgi:hypothetical protein